MNKAHSLAFYADTFQLLRLVCLRSDSFMGLLNNHKSLIFNDLRADSTGVVTIFGASVSKLVEGANKIICERKSLFAFDFTSEAPNFLTNQ